MATMMVVAIETEPTFSAGRPEVLFEGPYLQGTLTRQRTYDISPDGRFLMLKQDGGPSGSSEPNEPDLILVQNWFEELKRLAPPDP